MRRAARVVAGVLVVGAVTLIPAPSARAVGVCAGIGTMTTAQGLFDPVTTSISTTEVATVRLPVTTNFFLGLTSRGGVCVHTLGVETFFGDPSASGTVSGWCGHHSAEGVTSHGESFAWVAAGRTAVFTGAFVGVALLVTPLTADTRCNNATNFEVTGIVGGKTHCESTAGLTPVPVPPSSTTPAPGVDIQTGPWHLWTKVCIPTALA